MIEKGSLGVALTNIKLLAKKMGVKSKTDLTEAAYPLLWMLHDVDEEIGIIFDDKIESPVFIDPCLPDAFRFIILLGMKGGVMEVLKQKGSFSFEGILNQSGSALEALPEAL